MAYATIQVTINGVTKNAIDVSGNGVSVILEESLSAYDKKVMNDVSTEMGATFADKLAAHTMSNGKTAYVVYANFIKVVAEHDTATFKAYAANNGATVLVNHETRIDTLEAVP